MRRALVVALVVAAALIVPATAAAHATLEDASPATQSRVSAPPKEIRLHFNTAVTITSNAIRVYAPDGRVLSRASRLVSDGQVVVARVSGLRRGTAYTVRWRVTGSDGHSPAGVFTFGVGVKPPPPTEAVGAGGATWKDDVARWLLFAALALVIGPLVVRLVVLRGPVPYALERRFHLMSLKARRSGVGKSSSVRAEYGRRWTPEKVW